MATEIDLGVVKGDPADAEEVLALIGEKNLVDTEPVAGSKKLVQSGGVFEAVESAKDDTLNESLDRYVISNSVEDYEDLPTENLYDGLAYRVNSQGMYYAWRDDAWNIIDVRQVINDSPQSDDLPMTSAAVMAAIEEAHKTTIDNDANLSTNADTTDGYKVVQATNLVSKNISITRTDTSCKGVELNFDSEVSEGSHFDLVYKVPIGSEGLNTQLKITSGGVAVRTFPESATRGVYTGLAFLVKAKFLGGEWHCDIAVITTGAGIISPNVATYKVTFSGANRNATKDLSYTQTAEAGANVTLRNDIFKSFPSPAMTRKEWNTNADGSGTAYANNGVIANINSNLTLYPIWNEKVVTGTWNSYAKGGVYGNGEITVTKIFEPTYIEDYIEIKLSVKHTPANNGTFSVAWYCNGTLVATTNGGTSSTSYTATTNWIRIPRTGIATNGDGEYQFTVKAVHSASSDKKFSGISFFVSQARYH